jgi:hypothetical protein
LEPFQVKELLGRELVAEFLLQNLRVCVANAESKQRADVSQQILQDASRSAARWTAWNTPTPHEKASPTKVN